MIGSFSLRPCKGVSTTLTLLIALLCLTTPTEPAAAQVIVRNTITISAVQTQSPQPSIDGDLVAWIDGRHGSRDVYGYDFRTGQEIPIAVGGREKHFPQVCGDYVLWTERDSSTSRHIFAKNLTTGTLNTVVFGADYVDEYYHVVDGKVYFSAELGYNTGQHIYSYSLTTSDTEQISADPDHNGHRYPRGADGKVVWDDGATSGVIVYDVVTGQTTKYTTDGQDTFEPDVSGDTLVKVVWRSNRGTIETVNLIDGSTRVIDTDGKLTHPSIDAHLLAYVNYVTVPGNLRAIDLREDVPPTVIIAEPIVLQTQQSLEVSGNRIVWVEVLDEPGHYRVNVTTVVPEPSTAAPPRAEWAGVDLCKAQADTMI